MRLQKKDFLMYSWTLKIGSLFANSRKPRQVWKEATVSGILGGAKAAWLEFIYIKGAFVCGRKCRTAGMSYTGVS